MQLAFTYESYVVPKRSVSKSWPAQKRTFETDHGV